MDTTELVEAVLDGQRRALAQLLSAVEAGSEQVVREVITALHAHAGHAHTIGVTGSPGVGKSTLTGRIVGEQRRRGRTVGVLAVDPSSPVSGGALLGDRVRMAQQAADPRVFIRSMASRGRLGGLGLATPQALTVMDAAGFDVIVVETVGVGQAEVEIASLADTTVVTLAPGMGDGIQAAKAGILEVADVFVVNKADREGAERTASDLHAMQHMVTPDDEGWTPPILKTVAEQGDGVDALVDALDAHRHWAIRSGARHSRRRRALVVQIREIALAAVRSSVSGPGPGGLPEDVLDDVLAGRTDPYTAADCLLATARP